MLSTIGVRFRNVRANIKIGERRVKSNSVDCFARIRREAGKRNRSGGGFDRGKERREDENDARVKGRERGRERRTDGWSDGWLQSATVVG